MALLEIERRLFADFLDDASIYPHQRLARSVLKQAFADAGVLLVANQRCIKPLLEIEATRWLVKTENLAYWCELANIAPRIFAAVVEREFNPLKLEISGLGVTLSLVGVEPAAPFSRGGPGCGEAT